MNVVIRKSAVKDFKKISEPYKSKIKEKIVNLQNFPDISNIKKLINFTPSYRLRVGDYRILFDIVDNNIEVARIKHRKESY
jgi:mRNA interferase RelE/StbE